MKKYLFVLCIFCCQLMNAQTVLPLYPVGKIPDAKTNAEVKEKAEINKEKILLISQVTEPTLTVFLPKKEKSNGTAVVICPGGGYWVLASGHEGTDVARKLNEMGVTAFVLKYRLPDDRISSKPHLAPLQDAQRALQLVRENAKIYNINPNRIGILGFSAGGHLASTAGTKFKRRFIENPNNTSLRPDFMVLIYPVITSDTSIAHAGSHERLLGKDKSKWEEFSNEKQVTSETPPAFLVHASDDDGVKPENSIVFYLALRKNKVPVALHIYQKGGHGFGMNNPTTQDQWTDRLQNWFADNSWLKR
ncbi:MAG: alpha/beta hydrolase [Verrucomicrobia bacterium]|nr:alpha/beta hydrolase [Cytophagales bacterium]